MRNMGNAAEYFMFFKWKSKIPVCLYIFCKKNCGSNLLIIMIYVEKKIRLLRLTEIPRGAFQENCYDFNETAAPPGGLLGLIFATYVPLASQSPYRIIVFADPILVTFGQICKFCDPNLVTFYLCIYLINPLNRSSKNELTYFLIN